MSITSRINEMSSHIEQAYDELQGLGADLTNVNKNIENISMVLDDIYDSMPQVSGEGTSLTLDDTRVGKIKSTLKGNTSQTTYSGKNLANTKITNWNYLGVSVSYDEGTQILTINGTSTGDASLSFGNYNFSPISVSSGERLNLIVKYVSGSATSNDNGRILLADENYTLSMAIPLNGINTDKSEYKNVNSNLNYNILQFGYKNGDVYNNLKIKIMVCKGSDISYEPFVGGTASPNPSYPQPVNVVSGDNEITISNQGGTDSNTYNIDLPEGMELCKIGNYQDYFYKDRDKWYLHKEIGKYTFTGNETGVLQNSGKRFDITCLDNNMPICINNSTPSEVSQIYCNILLASSGASTWGGNQGISYNTGTNGQILVSISGVTTTQAYLSALKDNCCYYILATPTTIEVEYQSLIDQLNLLEKAMSKDGQTNISQVNNDLPFIISASALKEWQESTSLNSTLSMVNPLSLGNTLNTQENTQPIEVDNIEPLEEEENEES